MKNLKSYLFISAILLYHQLLIAQDNSSSLIQLKHQIKGIYQNNNSNFVPLINFQFTNSKKSPGLAILYSFLLPGMGELYAEKYESGIYFTVADGLLWSTVIGMNVYGNWKQSNYKSFATINAGIDPNGKDKDFFATISAYHSIDDYNNEKALERDFKSMLDKQKYYWSWNSVENRKTYRSMWSSSEQTFNNIRFAVGGLILNRIASVINAVRLTSRYNKKIADNELTFNVFFSKNAFFEDELIFNIRQKF